MSTIYSFLQKRKMHESQHGIIMVIIAYVLSILMLALGSDIFYNINTAAAGINTTTNEETKDLSKEETQIQKLPDKASGTLNTMFINPYSLQEAPMLGLNRKTSEEAPATADTVWLMGISMDNETFDNLMAKAGSIISENKAVQMATAEEVSTEEESKEEVSTVKATDNNAIESFSVEVASSDTVITITQEEVSMLERIVEAEAAGEDNIGKILIANVIFNRIADDEFPDNVEEVIFQHDHGDYQFSPVKSGRYWDVKISKQTKKAVERALEGEDYSEGALYFIARKHTASDSAKWFDNNLDWLFKHGGHEFYK